MTKFQKNDVVDVLMAPGAIAARAVVTDVYSDDYYGLELLNTGEQTASGPQFMTLVTRPVPRAAEPGEHLISTWEDLDHVELRDLYEIGDNYSRDEDEVEAAVTELLNEGDMTFEQLSTRLGEAFEFAEDERSREDDDEDSDDDNEPEDDIITFNDVPQALLDELYAWAESYRMTHDDVDSEVQNLISKADWNAESLTEAFKDGVVERQRVRGQCGMHISTVDDINDAEWQELGEVWRAKRPDVSVGNMREDTARVIATLPDNVKPMSGAFLVNYCATMWSLPRNQQLPVTASGHHTMLTRLMQAIGELSIPVVNSNTQCLGLLTGVEDSGLVKVKTLNHDVEYWHKDDIIPLDMAVELLRRR